MLWSAPDIGRTKQALATDAKFRQLEEWICRCLRTIEADAFLTLPDPLWSSRWLSMVAPLLKWRPIIFEPNDKTQLPESVIARHIPHITNMNRISLIARWIIYGQTRTRTNSAMFTLIRLYEWFVRSRRGSGSTSPITITPSCCPAIARWLWASSKVVSREKNIWRHHGSESAFEWQQGTTTTELSGGGTVCIRERSSSS